LTVPDDATDAHPVEDRPTDDEPIADESIRDEAEGDEPRGDDSDGAEAGVDDGTDDGPGEVWDASGDPRDVIANARRRHGAAGGVLAAGMFGLDQLLGRKPKEEIPVVVASSSDPTDIDADGIVIPLDANRDVIAPPMPRRGDPKPRKRAKRRREP
jgi:hypothetical protein